MQPPLWHSRHLVGGGLGTVATGLQTGSTVGIFSMLSSVPKLHVDRSSSETLRRPPLIYWTPSRIHAATSVAKQRPCRWSSLSGGYEPPNWLHRWNISYAIKRTKAACRQFQPGNAENFHHLYHWAPSRIHAASSVAKQTPCWWRSWTGGHGPPNWLHRCYNF